MNKNNELSAIGLTYIAGRSKIAQPESKIELRRG